MSSAPTPSTPPQPSQPSSGTWLGFTLRELVHLAILSALSLVGYAIGGPLHAFSLFGIQTLVTGPVIAFFGMYALITIPKPGTVTLLAIFSTIVTVAIHPTAMLYSVVAAMLAELITLAIWRSYTRPVARYVVLVLRVLLQLVVQVAYDVTIVRLNISQLLGVPYIVAIVLFATIALTLVCAALGQKVARELQKSGKLR